MIAAIASKHRLTLLRSGGVSLAPSAAAAMSHSLIVSLRELNNFCSAL